ncbi:MAG: hypothetical protein M5U30_05065 [Burkholderiaceae bacterium]|nr:hypothetical protein [Burkholderiaceae bacterium]
MSGHRKPKPGTGTLHERSDHEDEVAAGSDKGFGLTFCGLFLLLAGADYWLWSAKWWGLWLAFGAFFAAVSLSRPALLHTLNVAWTRFGMLLHVAVNPVVMAAIFAIAFVPVGMLMRALGKDPLKLRWDPHASTYWIARDPPGPDPKDMTNQF